MLHPLADRPDLPRVALALLNSGPQPAGLAPAQMEQLRAAGAVARRIRRAARVASFSGWTIGIVAFVSIVIGIVSSFSLAIGLAMLVIAGVELSGARGLRRFDARAPMRLALNQAAFILLLVGACLWSAGRALWGPDPLASISSATAGAGLDLAHLERVARVGLAAAYLGGAIIVILAQGSLAAYYATRRRVLRTHIAESPAWVLDVQREAA